MRRLHLSKDLKKGKELALSISRGRKCQQLCNDPKLGAYLAGLRNREYVVGSRRVVVDKV